jgi:zinc protease
VKNPVIVKYPYLTQDVEIYERENGHKIVLAHKEGELANVSTWVKTGSINEDDTNNGISHFLEHLMFKGTHKHPAGEFDKILEAKGAIVNAATWKDYTFYYVTLPKAHLFECIELHANMMLDPVLPEEEIGAQFDLNDAAVSDKRERHVVIEEIRMRKDQPWTKVYNACNLNMYNKHPYKRDVIGTPEIISKVTRRQIVDYYETFYSPQNMTTIIAGDFDKEAVLKKVEAEFDFHGRTGKPAVSFETDEPPAQTIYVENTANVNTSYLMTGWLGPKACDLKAEICLDLINIIFGRSTSSRLYQNLIEKQAEPVFNMISSENYPFRDGGNFFIQANFKPEKKEIALNLIKKEISDLPDVKISAEELEKAKKKALSGFACSAETVSEIGETIGHYMTVCENLKLIENYTEEVNEITVNDLEETIRKYLNISNAVFSILNPEG